jgi:LacI family transcriptional regulator
MTTIKDVAGHSGISIKTVSRVINGVASVRPNIRARVEASMRDLNYRPALAARQLAGGRSYIVALVAPRRTYSYFSRLMVAMSIACRGYGYHLVLEVIDVDDMTDEAAWSLRLSCEPDAVIVIPPFADDARILAALLGLGKPLVRVAGREDGVGQSLPVHDYAISREVAGYLLGKGHKALAMIAPPRPTMAAEERLAGFSAAAEAALAAEHIVRGDMTFAGGEAAFRALMALPQRPSAIFAANDQMALGAMACALRMGYRVPSDVAIVGFDNSLEGQMCYPALTSVHQPVEEIAAAAVALALGRCEGVPVFAHYMVARESA